MSDRTQAEIDFFEKLWRIANLQADTALKQAQTGTEVWKVVAASAAAGGATVVALVGLLKAFGG